MANVGHSDLEVLTDPPIPQYPPKQDIAPQGYYGKPEGGLPPYKHDQVPQSPWSPAPPQGYPIPQQQQGYSLPPPQPQQAPNSKRICGMGRKAFWIVVVIVLVIIIGAGVGAGVGLSNRKPKSYKPYPLETGRWNMKKIPPNRKGGSCIPDYIDAVGGCGDYDVPFVVNKVGDGYEIANAFETALNGPLDPPKSDADMWTRKASQTSQAIGVTATCTDEATITIKLGKTYQYDIAYSQHFPKVCKLNNGMMSPADQQCDCYWFGFLSQGA